MSCQAKDLKDETLAAAHRDLLDRADSIFLFWLLLALGSSHRQSAAELDF